MTIGEIFDLVRDDLDRVEAELGRHGESGIEPVTRVADYLRGSGGKRLRPALHLLAARLCNYQGGGAVRLGAVLELIHTATLVHDDVIDEAETRRGQPSANRRWGNSMTVLAGDWLYMESFRLALAERNLRILDVLIELTQMMVEGELIQLTQLGVLVDEAEALDLSRRKTAALFGACLRLGGLLAERPEAEEENLASYGVNVGMAFQIVDDLLDFTSTPERLGKPVLNDLREGKTTLPLIFALAEQGSAARKKVEQVLAEKDFVSVTREEIAEMVRRSGAIERCRQRARDFIAAGLGCLEPFPESSYKRALESIPQFILQRDY